MKRGAMDFAAIGENMANVPTNEAEAEYSEPVNSTSIKEALLRVIPDENDIVRDIRMHDGIADIMIRWRTLRWSTNMAYQTMTPDEIAIVVDAEFRKWLINIIDNMSETPKFSRVVNEMRVWIRENPDRATWLNREAA